LRRKEKMDKNLYRAFQMFNESYDLDLEVDSTKITRKSYFSQKEIPQICRFCNLSFPDTTFNTDSHLIPKFLGSKYLLSNYECDNCNSVFKLYENDFANFIGITRSINGISGKSKNPTYKKDGIKIFQESSGRLIIDSKDFVDKLKKGHDEILIEATRNKFTPINVFKALLKIAVSTIKAEEVENFRKTIEFVRFGEDNLYQKLKNSASIFQIFIPGPPIPEFPIIHMFKRKGDQYHVPERIMILQVRNFKYQVALPFNKNEKKLDVKTVDFPMVPVNLSEEYEAKHGKLQFENINLFDSTPIVNKKDGVGLKIRDLRKL
jgi:hypothetical protein